MENEPVYLIETYRKYARTYAIYTGIIVVLVVGVSFFVPQTWEASTTIMPPDSKSSGGGLTALLSGADLPIGIGGTENKLSTLFVEILKSRTLREGVIDTLKLDKHPLFAGKDRVTIANELERGMTIESRKSGTINVEVEVKTPWLPFGDAPAQASKISADIANACRTVLDKINRDKAVSQARKTRMYIERVLARTKSNIDSLQGIMQTFQQDNKVLVLDEQVQAIVGNAVDIGSELAKAQVEAALLEQDYRNTSPQMEMLRKRVSVLQGQYEKVQRGGLVAADGFSIPLEKAPALMRNYANMIRDIKIQEQLNIYLESQRMQEMIQEAKDAPTVIELDVALPPRTRTAPSRAIIGGVTVFLALVGFFVGVPLVTALRRKLAAA